MACKGILFLYKYVDEERKHFMLCESPDWPWPEGVPPKMVEITAIEMDHTTIERLIPVLKQADRGEVSYQIRELMGELASFALDAEESQFSTIDADTISRYNVPNYWRLEKFQEFVADILEKKALSEHLS